MGIISISKLVATELSAPNIMKALIKFIDEINFPITQAHFSSMDNINLNSGSPGGLIEKVHFTRNTDGFVGWLWQSQIGIMFQALAKRIHMCC